MRTNSVISARPNIYEFAHYRIFLKAWVEYLKATVPYFSLRSLARETRFSAAYLPLVLAGKRPLSETSLLKLAPHLKLNPSEQSFLLHMRRAAEAKSPTVRKRALERMLQSRLYREANPQATSASRYLSRWHHVAIQEMAHWPDFKGDAKWIGRRLSETVPLSEIQSALNFLLESGFLEKKSDGKIVPRQKEISLEGEVLQLALREFHHSMNAVSMRSMDTTPRERRAILGRTFAYSSEKFDQVKKILADTSKKLEALSESAGKLDCVYHVTLMATPITRVEGDEEGGENDE